ncbi:MAG: hypothetical protein JOY96_03050, partial [Verrucomicrobia bacterium]|nr:hypothetical protein [Verrucomicrobiota bacterium]
MKILILKLNATGDVVRTTSLLRRLKGEITWITAKNNLSLLEGIGFGVRPLTWENRTQALDAEYDLIINLEDDIEVAGFIRQASYRQLYGAYLDKHNAPAYTKDSQRWFDLSLISVHGRAKADQLKLQNRRTYQDLVFEGLGFTFGGEKYVLPEPVKTDLHGDVAVAPVAGAVWPMKNWAYYDELAKRLQAEGLQVNILPKRSTLLEHLGDVRNHRCLVGGDSLPMHLALGIGTSCVSIFNCTSPWEIFEYGI